MLAQCYMTIKCSCDQKKLSLKVPTMHWYIVLHEYVHNYQIAHLLSLTISCVTCKAIIFYSKIVMKKYWLNVLGKQVYIVIAVLFSMCPDMKLRIVLIKNPMLVHYIVRASSANNNSHILHKLNSHHLASLYTLLSWIMLFGDHSHSLTTFIINFGWYNYCKIITLYWWNCSSYNTVSLNSDLAIQYVLQLRQQVACIMYLACISYGYKCFLARKKVSQRTLEMHQWFGTWIFIA